MYIENQKAVSSGDHSFDARNDGKHTYCFSNEAWSASTKEVSFNVHGIVYVPESEAPSDPLEKEGTCHCSMNLGRHVQGLSYSMRWAKMLEDWRWNSEALVDPIADTSLLHHSERTHRTTPASQRRTILHHRPRADASKHS